MGAHYNIAFYKDLTKIIFQISSNTQLISSSALVYYKLVDLKMHCLAKASYIFSTKNNGLHTMSHVMRKPAFCTCENKDLDLLRNHCAADHRLRFHFTDSTIPLLPKTEISSL